jgi:GxxExxY protein
LRKGAAEETNTVNGAVVDAAYRIHEDLGPGLFESVYESVLADLLIAIGFAVQRQVPVPSASPARSTRKAFAQT